MSNGEWTDGAAVEESLSHESSERRTGIVVHDGTWLVSRRRTCADESPDKVDVLTDSHLGIKAAEGLCNLRPHDPHRRRDVGDP